MTGSHRIPRIDAAPIAPLFSPMTALSFRGLCLELAELPSCSSAGADLSLDSTGVGQLWEPATSLLCDYLQAVRRHIEGVPSVLELGAGLGVPGMLCATLGARSVTLTDYHPLVLEQLRKSVAANPAAASRCTVERLEWGVSRLTTEQPFPLVLGADLAFAERSGSALGAALLAHLAADGVFLYAHQERRAVTRAADGSIAVEPHDGALCALQRALRPLHCRQLHAREAGEAHGGERVLLLAFGRALAVAALPPWQPAGVEAWAEATPETRTARAGGVKRPRGEP